MIYNNIMKTLYTNDTNQVTIICPKCNFMKDKNAANFKNAKKVLKAKCRCGEVFRFTIEFRKHYRKKVKLPGEYTIKETGKKGEMAVEDLSMSGIRFVNLGSHQISPDDMLEVKFKLDNQMRSEIYKQVRIVWVKDNVMGAQFIEEKSFKSDLGFYLKT